MNRHADAPSQDGAADFKSRVVLAVKSSRTVGQRAADVLDERRVSGETAEPASGPCCFSQGNVSVGGRSLRDSAIPFAHQTHPTDKSASS